MINVDEMIKECNKELVEEYPFLLPRNVRTDELDKDYDYSYTLLDCVPDGWMDLFLQMCEDLKKQLIEDNFLENFRFTQIKEKWGKLQLHNSSCSRKAYRILDNYTYISQFVCYKCGKPAKLYDILHYTLPYCKDCLREQKKKVAKRSYLKKPIRKIGTSYKRYYIYKRYSSDYTLKEKIDTKDIWRRLYYYV